MAGGNLAPMLATVILLAAAVAPVEAARAEVALTLDGGWALASDPALAGPSVDGTVKLTYRQPVKDDATPIALQPFLQRRLAFRLEASFGTADRVAGMRRGGVRYGVEGTGRWPHVLDADGAYRFFDGAAARHSLVMSMAGVLRFGDLRLALGMDYRVPIDGGPLLLRARIDLRLVVLEHLDIRIGAVAWLRGIDAHFYATWYPSRRLGLVAGGYGGGVSGVRDFPDEGHFAELLGHPPIALPDAAHLGLLVGFTFWRSPGFNVGALYCPSWIAGDTAGLSEHRAVLTVGARM